MTTGPIALARDDEPETPAQAPDESVVAARSPRHRWALILLAQVGLSCVTGLFALGRKSLWFDETFTFAAAHRSLGSLTRLVVTTESNMAPYDYLLHFWLPLGRAESTMRLPSVLFFVATVPILSTLVDRTFGRRPAVVAGFLLALNPFAVLYAQELRAYSMVMCGVTASTALFVECVRSPRRWVLVAYVLVNVVSFGAHYFAVLAVAAQLASLAWLPDVRGFVRRTWPAYAAIAVLSLPLAAFVYRHRDSPQIDWVPPLSWSGVVAVGHLFVGDTASRPWGLWVLVVVVAVGAVATFRPLAARARSDEQSGKALLWCAFVVPVALLVVACVAKDLWVARYVIVVLPAFVGLAAVGVTSPRRPALQAVGLVLVTVVFVGGLLAYYPGEERFDEDWRGVSHYLAEPGVRGHAVLFNPGYLRLGADYYPWAQGLPQPSNIGIDGDGDAVVTATPATVVRRLEHARGGVAYVVQRGDDLEPALGTFLVPAGYHARSSAHFGSLAVVTVARNPTKSS